jgi:F-type H+-transporting ATPase subunit alpha
MANTQTLSSGVITQVASSWVKCDGLTGATLDEMVIFENHSYGQVIALHKDSVDCIAFSDTPILPGTTVTRAGKQAETPVGTQLLGMTIDPFGNSMTDTPIEVMETRPLHSLAPGIIKRKRIHHALFTGTKTVDLLLPLGKGQRELVIGDRKTGKTQFLLQTLLFQVKAGSIGIYVGIGKKKADIKKVQDFLKANGIENKCVIIASSSDDPTGVIYLTPYTGMTIAEYFRDQEKEVLLILDDLSTHARFYREIALITNRFPGKNAYPSDIFSVHARLLERAGNFVTDRDGEASITCLPVVETLQGDLSGYIETNIMSMTDGHLFFDSDLFTQGRRPAINPFLSVTRVGRQTQDTLQREISSEVITFLTNLQKVQSYTHFGAELSQEVKNTLQKGEQLLAFFQQTDGHIIDQYLQIYTFGVMWEKLWPDVNSMLEEVTAIEKKYQADMKFQEYVYDLVNESESLKELTEKIKK